MDDSPYMMFVAQDANDMTLLAAFMAQLVREGIAFSCEYTVSGRVKITLTGF